LAELYDTIICDLYLGRPIPDTFNDHDMDELRYIQNYILILIYGGELARVESTPIASAIISKM